MTQEEIDILSKTLDWANEYFTRVLDIIDTAVYSQEEIDQMEDECEQEAAQTDRDYEDLLGRAQEIIDKYKKGEIRNA